MPMTDAPMFGLIKRKISWLTQRQEILASNIANSDTPKYKAEDIAKFDFKQVLRDRRILPVNVVMTNAAHLQGQRARVRDFNVAEERQPYETAPDGNSVVLEEQMVKSNETAVTHNLMVALYKKHLAMLKLVSRRVP